MVCAKKQSMIKVFHESNNASECRQVVMQLNMSRGKPEELDIHAGRTLKKRKTEKDVVAVEADAVDDNLKLAQCSTLIDSSPSAKMTMAVSETKLQERLRMMHKQTAEMC